MVNAADAFTHSQRIVPLSNDSHLDGIDLVALQVQSAMAGQYTIYYAVNLVNGADGADGDSALVGTRTIEVRPRPTAITGTATLSEPESQETLLLALMGTDHLSASVTEYTLISAARGDARALPSTVSLAPGLGVRSALTMQPSVTVPAGYNHSIVVGFRVHDGTLESAPAVYTLNFTPLNNAPQAPAQSLATNEDVALSVALSATDLDLDPVLNQNAAAESLTYRLDQLPRNGRLLNGAVELTSGAVITPMLRYEPAADFNGSDSFAWSVEDAAGERTSSMVSLAVNAVDDPPVVVLATGTVRQGANAVSLALAAMDVDGPYVMGALVFAYQIVSLPRCGALSAPAAGDMNPADDAALSIGSVVTGGTLRFHYGGGPVALADRCNDLNDVTFTYQALHQSESPSACTATPPSSRCSSLAVATVEVTQNNPPAVVDSAVTVAENGVALFEIGGTDGESMPATLMLFPPTLVASTGTVTLLAATPPDPMAPASVGDPFVRLLRYAPPLDFNGAASLRYQVRDPDGALSAFATLSITVTPVNSTPLVTPLVDSRTDEDTSVDVMLVAVDPDAVPALNTHAMAAAMQSVQLRFAIATLPITGTLFWLLADNNLAMVVRDELNPVGTQTLRYVPAGDDSGAYSMQWRARDTLDARSPLVVQNFEVSPVNDAPAAADVTLDVDEDAVLPLSFLDGSHQPQLRLLVSDVEGSRVFRLRFAAALPAQAAYGSIVDAVDASGNRIGLVDGNGNVANAQNYRPPPDFHGELLLDYSVQESSAPQPESSSARLTMRVAPINDTPTVTGNDLTINTQESFAEVLGPNVFNAEDVDGDTLTYTITQWPASTATLTKGGSVALRVGDQFTQQDVDDGEISVLVPQPFDARLNLSLNLTDGALQRPIAVRRRLAFVAENLPPELLVPDVATDGGTMRFSVLEGGTLTFLQPGNLNNPPPGALRVYDQGVVTFTMLTNADAVAGHLYLSSRVGGSCSGAAARIASGDTFTQAEVARGCVFYRHSGAESGDTALTLSVTDMFAAASLTPLTIAPNIVAVNDPPVRVTNAGIVLASGAEQRITRSALAYRDDDDPATALVYIVGAAPAEGDLLLGSATTPLASSGRFTQQDLDDGQLRYRHRDSLVERDRFTYSLCDSGGNLAANQDRAAGRLCDAGALEITITPVNRVPVANDDFADASEYQPDGTEIVVPVLANDSDADNSPSPLRIVALSGAAPGARASTVAQVVDGVMQDVVRYTPPRPAPAQDHLSYTVSDGAASASASLIISIAPATDSDGDGLADIWETRLRDQP